MISVGGGFTVDFLNNGSILGNALLQTSNSASFNFRNKGILGGNVNISNDTGTFNFSNDGTAGGIFNFQNNQDIPQLNFNINTRGATTNLGSADFEKLNINANGSSHDVYSSFLMYYNQNVTVDELYAYGLQDTSFLEEWLEKTFEGSGGGKMTFRYVDGSPQTVPEPATMLLLCTGLIGLWGTKRFRLIG